MANNHKLPTIADYIFLILLFLIHAIDMECIRHSIGRNWVMERSITHFDIYNVIWLNRAILYSLIYAWCFNYHKPAWKHFLYVGTTLYWVSMAVWMFTLRI